MTTTTQLMIATEAIDAVASNRDHFAPVDLTVIDALTRKLEAAIAAGDEDEASDGAYFLLRAAGMTCDTCRGMLEHPWQEYCSQECYRGRS